MDELTKQTLHDIYEFLEAFVDYHIDEPSVLDPGEMTDAQILSTKLPVLKKLLDETKNQETNNPEIEEFMESVFGADEKTMHEIRSHLNILEYRASERINPNYRYCVVDGPLHECYLTDDIGRAMELAASKSKVQGMWSVLRIEKVKDGSYKTFKECFYSGGEYFDSNDYWPFLHFYYIARQAKVQKI